MHIRLSAFQPRTNVLPLVLMLNPALAGADSYPSSDYMTIFFAGRHHWQDKDTLCCHRNTNWGWNKALVTLRCVQCIHLIYTSTLKHWPPYPFTIYTALYSYEQKQKTTYLLEPPNPTNTQLWRQHIRSYKPRCLATSIFDLKCLNQRCQSSSSSSSSCATCVKGGATLILWVLWCSWYMNVCS